MDHQVENKKKKEAYILIICLLFVVVAISIVINPEFIDYYYMKATGDYLLKGGSFNVNPFTVNDLGIITQQWLYCIWIAFVDKGGPVLVFCTIVLYLLLLLGTIILYVKQHSLDIYKAFSIFFVAVIVSGGYLVRIRPETISVILLILQIVVMEKTYISKKVGYLYLMLPIMLIEINIHGSVWFVHYLIILAYVFPNLFKKYTIDNQLNKSTLRKHMCISSVLMGLTMFINPYGYKMIMYTFISLNNKSFEWIKIVETQKPIALSFVACMVYILVVLVAFGFFNKILRISSVYLALGFGLMTLMMNRNIMFAIIGYVVVIVDIVKYYFVEKEVKICFKIKKRDLLFFKVVFVFFAFTFIIVFYEEIIVKKWDTDFSYPNLVDYVNNHYEKNDNIYAVTQVGSYFEYNGYNKVYTDSRAEIFSKEINGKKDVLKEYDTFGQGIFNYDIDSISAKKMEEYLDSYDFKCLIVSKYESALYYYLIFSDEYNVSVSEKGFYLFEKNK